MDRWIARIVLAQAWDDLAGVLRKREAERRAIRRARQAQRTNRRGAPGRHTFEEWQAVVARYGDRCAYCGIIPAKLIREHRIPIARGGTNDITNIVPACAPCNGHKGTRTDAEFLMRT